VIEVSGVNYMVPVDAKLASDLDAEGEAVDLGRLIRTIEPARRLRLACRLNARSMCSACAGSTEVPAATRDMSLSGLNDCSISPQLHRSASTSVSQTRASRRFRLPPCDCATSMRTAAVCVERNVTQGLPHRL
jgi:hypothetical protein